MHQEVIALTSKEYAILEYWLRIPDHVLPHTQIAGHVWKHDFGSMSNVVGVCTGNLRRKPGDDRELRLRHTIRGTGYPLKVPA